MQQDVNVVFNRRRIQVTGHLEPGVLDDGVRCSKNSTIVDHISKHISIDELFFLKEN